VLFAQEAAPVRTQTGAPVGAKEPMDPVMVAVKVVTWPPDVVVWIPRRFKVVFAFGTGIVTIGELDDA